MGKVRISVVIPVYNVEKYLCQCLDSILCQNFQDMEIIAVDDGSTDNSGAILDEYAAKDARIKVIHQHNQGVGVARNTALTHVTGEYVTFVDSDDFLFENCLDQAVSFAENCDADIVILQESRFHDDTGIVESTDSFSYLSPPPPGVVFSVHDDPDNFLFHFGGMVWAKLFRRELLEQTGVRFLPLINAEDTAYALSHLIMAKRVAFSDVRFYHYRLRNEGNICSHLENHPICFLQALESIYDLAKTLPFFDEIKRGLANYNAHIIKYYLFMYKTPCAFLTLYHALRTEGLSHLELLGLPRSYFIHDYNAAIIRRIERGEPILPKRAKNLKFWKSVTFFNAGILWFSNWFSRYGLKNTLRQFIKVG